MKKNEGQSRWQRRWPLVASLGRCPFNRSTDKGGAASTTVLRPEGVCGKSPCIQGQEEVREWDKLEPGTWKPQCMLTSLGKPRSVFHTHLCRCHSISIDMALQAFSGIYLYILECFGDLIHALGFPLLLSGLLYRFFKWCPIIVHVLSCSRGGWDARCRDQQEWWPWCLFL